MALQSVFLASAGSALLLSGCSVFPSETSGDVSTTEPDEGTTRPADVTIEPAEATTTPHDVTTEPADADVTTEPADATAEPANATTTAPETTPEPTTTTKTTAEPTTTKETKTTTTTKKIVGMQTYCPSKSDLVVAYGDDVKLSAQGWVVQGDGGAATKAAFNLMGGSVEYDLDVSAAKVGVIPNMYSISPRNLASSGFDHDKHYCDADGESQTWCLEHDWIESNGHCGGATALHSVPGEGPESCNAWGCLVEYQYQGASKFHMRIDYDETGRFTVTRDGQELSGYEPAPQDSDYEILRSTHQEHGAVIYSSQWTGAWVPVEDCGAGPGDLAGSKFSISNLRIQGEVMQGPRPALCSEQILV